MGPGFPSCRGDITNEEVMAMPKYRKFDEDFKAGAVRIVEETGKPIAQVARDLGVNQCNWCASEVPQEK